MKTIIVIILFIGLFFGEIAISFSHRSEEQSNFKSSEYIPISQSLDNFYSSHYQTIAIDNYISEFLNKWDIKGASVSIAKDGRLVYSKGFGYANKEEEETVKPKHLFRIASVSKLITAVGIMKLYEEGKLNLNDTVFGINGWLNDSVYSHINDERIYNITIDHLLHHTSGFGRAAGDPMFSPLYIAHYLETDPPVNLEDVTRFMLMQKLSNVPGTRYRYSNFGYALLGEIIEKASGMQYENYIKFAILDPLGIYDMKIGHSFYEEKDSNEVKYYEPIFSSKCYSFDGSGDMVQKAYGGNDIKLLGPAGGWIASSAELLKLVVAIDGFSDKPDILKPETIELMTTPDEHGNSFIGWRGADTYGTWWRTGTLAGTSALVMRQYNNINWVVLLNTSTMKNSRIHNDISRTMFKALSNIDDWPPYDLFHYYQVRSGEENLLANIK